MLQPEHVTASLYERFGRHYPDWARDRGTWPLRVGLRPPSTSQRSTDPVACHRWAAAWRDYPGPGRIEYANLRFSTGTHSMPKALIFDHPSQVADIHPQSQQLWQRCDQRLTHLKRTFPNAVLDGTVRRITDLDEPDYQRLANTVAWLRANPTSGLMLRQLPIEGIGTKWLLRHRVLVLALLGEDNTADTEGEDAPTASSRRRLHERLGLRVPPEMIQVALLDPRLRAYIGGMKHFAASVDDLNQWEHLPHTVVLLENLETGYAMTDDHPGTAVLHGRGFAVASYAAITWVRNAHQVIYWGDIDGPGLQFVHDLRSYGITAETVLMDTATLERFRHLAIDGAAPQRATLPNLTKSEAELYAHLAEYAQDQEGGLLLEQERIPWQHAYDTLIAAMSTVHS